MTKKANSFQTETQLHSKNNPAYKYFSIPAFEKATGKSLKHIPFSLKILLENLLRNEDGVAVRKKDIEVLAQWEAKAEPKDEIQFTPARVVLQDFTGVPAVADLAAMRGAISKLGGNPDKINPLVPADLVIDHSVMIDHFGSKDAFQKNADLEYQRNGERYQFLRWGQGAFKHFRVVPPDTGIIHQVNLEYLSHVAMVGGDYVYPDTMVGTDSHTTMINGLGCLGWGVGGIEAEAAMLGQPCSMLIPQVVGFELKGRLPAGTTATDLVLTVTNLLRKHGVVGKFVEFFGEGLKHLSLADRATIANMAPEYGATVGLFPVDEKTTQYLRLTGRSEKAQLVEEYYKAQGLWYSDENQKHVVYSSTLALDMNTVEPSLAGPARPQDRVSLGKIKDSFVKYEAELTKTNSTSVGAKGVVANLGGKDVELPNGAVVLTAITSCTNTSNPSVLIAAGLLAKKAREKGLTTKPWVKTSLAPGSKVVTDYLTESKLLPYLEELGFHVVAYGCTTCIGNSGPLPDNVTKAIVDQNLAVASVLSGNRNFEGRVNPHVKANYLASPPLCVAYALAGSLHVDLTKDPIGKDTQGKDVFLKDIWPSESEVQSYVDKHVTESQFKKSYAQVFQGESAWQKLPTPTGKLYAWDSSSTYIKEPPFFENLKATPDPVKDITGARVLAILGDSVTTDHISPAGSFNTKSEAGKYLSALGVKAEDYNGYGARRGNHEVMMRGTFANTRLKNLMLPGVEGSFAKHLPTGQQVSLFEASMRYQKDNTPLVILAGKEYGTGSSRDWAAKGPKLLGIKVVITESFERIHRSNLVGMGILPLQFINASAQSLGLTGEETFNFRGLTELEVGGKLTVEAEKDGKVTRFDVKVRIDTPNELEYYKHGGILSYVLRQQLASK